MPHSVFLGRVVGPGEPEWLGVDRDKVRFVLAERSETCSRCGTKRSEWGEWAVDKEGRRFFKRFDPPPYVAKTVTDPGCEAIDKAYEAQRTKSKDTAGVTAVLDANPAARRRY